MPLQHAETSSPSSTHGRRTADDALPLWRSANIRDWQAAAIWLADLHIAPVPRDGGDLPRHDRRSLRRVMERALLRHGDAVAPLADDFERAVARLAHRPVGLVHGAFYASNVRVDHPDGLPRIRAVAWDHAGVGCGLLDLAALLSGVRARDNRTRVAAAYASALPPGLRPSARELVAGLDDAHTVLATQWLAGPDDLPDPVAQPVAPVAVLPTAAIAAPARPLVLELLAA